MAMGVKGREDFLFLRQTLKGVKGKPSVGVTRQRRPTGTNTAGSSGLIWIFLPASICFTSSPLNVCRPPWSLKTAGAYAASHSKSSGANFLVAIDTYLFYNSINFIFSERNTHPIPL